MSGAILIEWENLFRGRFYTFLPCVRILAGKEDWVLVGINELFHGVVC